MPFKEHKLQVHIDSLQVSQQLVVKTDLSLIDPDSQQAILHHFMVLP